MIFVARKAPVPQLSLLRPSRTRKRQPFRWKSQKWRGRVRCKRMRERMMCLGSENFRNFDPFIPILKCSAIELKSRWQQYATIVESSRSSADKQTCHRDSLHHHCSLMWYLGGQRPVHGLYQRWEARHFESNPTVSFHEVCSKKWSSHSEPSISIEIIKQWCDLLEFTIRTLFQTWLLRCACVTSLWRKIHWCSCFANTPCKYCKSCQFSMMQHVCTIYMKHPKTVFAGLGTLSSLKSLKLSRQPRQHASGYPRPSLEQVWCPEQTKTHGVVFILFEATSHNFS